MKIIHNHQPQFFKQYSQFKDLSDFNRNFEMWAADIKKVIPKRQYNFLVTLKKFMAKVAGISTAKYKTIVKASNDTYNAPTSERTAQRIMPLLAKFGIVKMYDSKMQKTNLRGANIIVFQRYDVKKAKAFLQFKNGGTEEINETVKIVATTTTNTNDTKNENGGTLNNTTKTINIKLLNTNKARVYNHAATLVKKFKIQKTKTITLFTKTIRPLSFVSRLKDILYKNNVFKNDVNEIVSICYAKVYAYTKFDAWKEHKDTMLEHCYRIVEDVIMKQSLLKIKSLKGFINHRLDQEIEAYIHNEIEKIHTPTQNVCQKIVDIYSNALENSSRKPPFYNWLEE